MKQIISFIVAGVALLITLVVLTTGCGCGGAPPVVTIEADDVLCSVDVSTETVDCVKDGHTCTAELGPELKPTNIHCEIDGEVPEL